MALISLTGKDTSEAFRLDDHSIIFVDTITGGSRLTISDNKEDTRNILEVSESPAAIAALTTKLLQITDPNTRATTYINIDRIVEVKNSGDSSDNAVLIYNDNGDEYKYIKVNQTIAQFITSYNTQTRPYKIYRAIMNQLGAGNAPTAIVLENTIGTIVWTYYGVGTYVGTLADAFTTGKTTTFAVANSFAQGGEPAFAELQTDQGDDDVVYLFSYVIDGSVQNSARDSILFTNQCFIEIRVYE